MTTGYNSTLSWSHSGSTLERCNRNSISNMTIDFELTEDFAASLRNFGKAMNEITQQIKTILEKPIFLEKCE